MKEQSRIIQITYEKYKAKLESKCQRFGIQYHLIDEASTSRTDALALDEIKEQPCGKKRMINRELLKSATGGMINADIDRDLNILRKVAGDPTAREIISRGLINRLQRIRLAYEASPSLKLN